MEEKQEFMCSYCGVEYDSAPARARCELECDTKRKQEAEWHRREKLQKNRNDRLSEIKKKFAELEHDVILYSRDYNIDDLIQIMRVTKLDYSPFWLFWA